MKKKMLLGAVFILLAGCASFQKQPFAEDQIVFNAKPAPVDFDIQNFPEKVQENLRQISQKDHDKGPMATLMLHLVSDKELTQRQTRQLWKYFSEETESFTKRREEAVARFFAETKKKKIDLNLYTKTDRNNVLNTLQLLYQENSDDPRVLEWTGRLDEKTTAVLRKRIEKELEQKMTLFSRQAVKDTILTEVTDAYSPELLDALVLQCRNMGWFSAMPSTAKLLLDTLPQKEISTSAQNYKRLQPMLERTRLGVWPAFATACQAAVGETKRYFTNEQLEKFRKYMDEAVLPLVMNPDIVSSNFSYSKTPRLEAIAAVNKHVNPIMKKMYYEERESFADNAVILHKLTSEFKDSAERLSQSVKNTKE